MATTALLYETKSVLWRIPNFAEVRKTKELLYEQHFKFEMTLGVVTATKTIAPVKWECRLQTVDQEEKFKNHVGIFVYVVDHVPAELSKCHAKVDIKIAPQGQAYYFLEDAFGRSLKKMVKGYGLKDVIPLVSETTPFLSEDGTLEIQVTVTVYHPEVQNAKLAVLEAEYKDYFAKNLRYNLDDLRCLTNRDTKIVAKDGVEIPVHHFILAARSPVFRAMFQSNLSEAQSGLVEVKDIDSKPLEVLLHLIHTGELTLDWKNEGIIEGLVYGAHKYMLEDLLEFLDEVLVEVCTDENCDKVTGLAKTFGLKKAEGHLFDYFKKNLAKDLDEVLKFVEETTLAATLMVTQPESEQQESG